MMKTTYFIGLAALTMALVGCSKDSAPMADDWNGEIRLSSGITVQTRVLNDYQSDQLSAQNPVGVYINEHGGNSTTYTQNMEYVPTGLGAFMNAPTVYFPSSGNAVDIYAYAPRNAEWMDRTANYTFSVQSNQIEKEGYVASDLLWGQPMSMGDNPIPLNPVARTKSQINLGFRHLLSKVKVKIKAGAGLTAADVDKVSIQNVLPTTTFNMADGTLAEASGDKINVEIFDSKGLLVMDEGSAIVVPQTVPDGTNFLRFGLESGGELFYKLPAALTLKGGRIYEFTITVNLTGLTVKSTIIDWTTGTPIEGDAEMPEPMGSKSVEMARVGDFYFMDGSLESGGSTLTPEQIAACVGVVYWLGDPTNSTNGDPMLAAHYPNCRHGLVACKQLLNVPDSLDKKKMLWTYGGFSSVQDQLGTIWPEAPSGCNLTEAMKIQGYTNTLILEKFNEYVEDVNNNINQNQRVKPICALHDFIPRNPAPKNTSNWYWPSIYELKLMWSGPDSSEGLAGLNMLNEQFQKIDGWLFTEAEVDYWSNTEDSNYSTAFACNINWYLALRDVKHIASSAVRPIAAF